MNKFSVKVAIIPSKPAPLDAAEEIQIANLTALFTRNSLLPESQTPNLDTFVIEPLVVSADEVKEGDTYDHVALMKLLGQVPDEKTFVLFVKTTTVSTVEPNGLVKLVYDLCEGYLNSAATEKAHFDVMYLAKWADRCDLQRPLGTVFNKTVNLVETSEPHGLQAIVISPAGANKLKAKLDKPFSFPVSFALTRLVSQGELSALATTPNVMNFGSQFATSSSDYLKTMECAIPPSNNGKPTPKSSDLSLFIFVAIFLVVIGIFYFIVTMVSTTPSPVGYSRIATVNLMRGQ